MKVALSLPVISILSSANVPFSANSILPVIRAIAFALGPLVLRLNRVILTLKFVLLVGGTPMRLKFILDPLLYMLILLRLCSLGICSLPVLSFSRVLFAPLVLIKAKCIE